MISRRAFLALSGVALVMWRFSWAEDMVPSSLDHLLLGCNDLDSGIEYVEKRTGVRAAIGGVHPGMGTRNALLALGDRCYLEIIAPDPEQKDANTGASPRLDSIKRLTAPRLIEWAAHVDDIEELAGRLEAEGVVFSGPHPGSRKRPDGRVLSWKVLGLADNHGGLLPFFIEWGGDSVHPSIDAPKGCHLASFAIAASDPPALEKALAKLSLEVPVRQADKPGLQVQIAGPKGNLA